MFRTNILGTPIIVSTDPEVNKVILLNHGSTFIPAYPKSITELFGKNSILQINGTLQKKVHSLIGGFMRSPQLKARMTREIEHSVKSTLSTWKDMHEICVQDEAKKVSSPPPPPSPAPGGIAIIIHSSLSLSLSLMKFLASGCFRFRLMYWLKH